MRTHVVVIEVNVVVLPVIVVLFEPVVLTEPKDSINGSFGFVDIANQTTGIAIRRDHKSIFHLPIKRRLLGVWIVSGLIGLIPVG